MKRCSKCGELKDESEFYKDATKKDGLSYICKSCKYELYFKNGSGKYYKPKSKQKPIPNFDVLGGYKISILNYTKKGEYKFNIIQINGEPFMTNNKNEFVHYITRNC